MFHSDSVQDKKFSQCSLFLCWTCSLFVCIPTRLSRLPDCSVIWLSAPQSTGRSVPCLSAMWRFNHTVLCVCVVWRLDRSVQYFFLQSDHLNTLCSVTSWLQYSVYYCRLRPYHNDLYSLQGDHLIAQCVYNSEERSTITLGGLTTREEMCLVFALYYPRIDMSLCHSLPSLPTVLHSLGIQELWPWVLICLLIINFDIWFDGTIH